MTLLFLALFACDPEPKIVTETLTDEGTVCLNDAGLAEVTFPGCLSSSCDSVVESSCTVELADGVVTVHATATIEREQGECTSDCGFIQVTCEMPLIEDPSTVVFSYAGQTTDLSAECAPF
jgi:hypothetical protein